MVQHVATKLEKEAQNNGVQATALQTREKVATRGISTVSLSELDLYCPELARKVAVMESEPETKSV